MCEPNSRATLVDLGCGDGAFTARAGHRIGTTRIVGIDITLDVINELVRKDIKGIHADLNREIPLGDESTDVVIASQIIEHLNDTDKFVKEMYRILRPGGYAVVATPNLAGLYNILFLIIGKQPPVTSVSDAHISTIAWDRAVVSTFNPIVIPRHRRVFTRGALKSMLQFYGFRCEKVVMSGFPPLPWFAADFACCLIPMYGWNIIVKARKPEL